MFSFPIIIREALRHAYSIEEYLNPRVLVQSDVKYSVAQFSFRLLFGQIFDNFKLVLAFMCQFGRNV
jgi:hypothetical protein